VADAGESSRPCRAASPTPSARSASAPCPAAPWPARRGRPCDL